MNAEQRLRQALDAATKAAAEVEALLAELRREAVHNVADIPTTREWLGIDELAAELGLPESTIYTWRARGRGPRAHKIGKYVKFRRSDVEAWLATLADGEVGE